MFAHRPARKAALPAAFLLLTSGLVVAAPPTTASAATIVYVNAGAGGSGSGTSWTDAYTSLADALSATPSGSEIWVAAGRYTPTDGTDRTATFQLTDGVAVYGGFAGGETQRDQRDWQANVTTLSGDLNGDDGANFANNSENSYHVVTGATGATLDGVTISGGNADGTAGHPWSGGGVYDAAGSPTLAHLVIRDNVAVIGAGMAAENGSSPTLTDVLFDGNASSNGGGLSGDVGATLTLTDVAFTGNTAQGGRGGGLYTAPGAVTVTLTDVTFRGNSATYGGGLIFFTGNTATLANVLVTGNSAVYGGGLLTTGSSDLTLTNATISGNAALLAGTGGGMWNENGSTPQVRNSILWGNGSSNVVNINDVGKPISVPVFSSSLVQGSGGSGAWNPSFGTDGGGNLDADPQFVTPVPPPAPSSGGDLHLGTGSPAIDTGDNGFLPAGLVTDLDGNPRIFGGTVDMGAYEAQDTTPPDTTIGLHVQRDRRPNPGGRPHFRVFARRCGLR
jgi:predicted outer membrane repeat protein